MITKTIFNMDGALKKAAMRKARGEGLSLSAVLNLAARAYVSQRFEIGLFERSLAKSKKEAGQGRVISQDALFRKLSL